MIIKYRARCFCISCALAAMTRCAKSDIVSAQEYLGAGPYGRDMSAILVNNPTAQIGQKKTPWMFIRPDGKSGFANDFTTNALSVVSEDDVNFYAHVEDKDGDRTKVIHFTIDENGIPSRQGDVIDTTASGEENNAEEMKKRKLIGVQDGYLCFYPTDQYGTSLIYNPQRGDRKSETVRNEQTGEDEPAIQKCLASCQRSNGVHLLCNVKYTDSDGERKTKTVESDVNEIGEIVYYRVFSSPVSDKNMVMSYSGNRCYLGDSEGNVALIYGSGLEYLEGVKLPGAISGITERESQPGVLVTSAATNAFYNTYDGEYNGVGRSDPLIPPTKDGLIRVIDNSRKNGKFIFVTTKGVHSIDD